MAKKAYPVRNWKDYNRALIARGSIFVWVDKESIGTWYEENSVVKRRGRAQKYSDTAILTMLTVKQVFRLSLRSCQGWVKSLFQLMGLKLDVPDYTRVCRRQGNLPLKKLPGRKESIHLVIDSSGLKVFGEGEWKVRQHGWTKHRTWRKIHLGIDEKSQLIVTGALTGNECGDDQKLPELLANYAGLIRQVSADGAYDSHACFNEIHRYGAIPTIPPQSNPRHKPKLEESLKTVRDQVVWEIQKKGREAWKRESGYHRRSLAETAMYRFKQLFGDKLSARKWEQQQTEALVRCHALNRMTLLGMPVSVVVE